MVASSIGSVGDGGGVRHRIVGWGEREGERASDVRSVAEEGVIGTELAGGGREGTRGREGRASDVRARSMGEGGGERETADVQHRTYR